MKATCSRAPGKLILAGEHAAVHGALALVVAIERWTQVELRPSSEGIFIRSALGQGYWPNLEGPNQLAAQSTAPWIDLTRWKWLEKLLELLPTVPSTGWELEISSQLPLGSGMGSSAAVIAATLSALNQAFELALTPAQAWQIARAAEHCCHGRSSGLDLAASLFGGGLCLQGSILQPLMMASVQGVYSYFSGPASDSTADCVRHTTQHFVQYPEQLGAMQQNLEHFKRAMEEGHWPSQRDCVKAYHRALCTLGVVPKGIEKWIGTIEAAGGAAKISGAGSLQGPTAGMILIWAQEPLVAQMRQEGYPLHPVSWPLPKGAWPTSGLTSWQGDLHGA